MAKCYENEVFTRTKVSMLSLEVHFRLYSTISQFVLLAWCQFSSSSPRKGYLGTTTDRI